jgi:hypothetical protein
MSVIVTVALVLVLIASMALSGRFLIGWTVLSVISARDSAVCFGWMVVFLMLTGMATWGITVVA